MAEGMPPPPTYSSLFQGEGQDHQHHHHPPFHAPPLLPPDAPPEIATFTPPVGRARDRNFSRQASLESPYPPTHPFYPCPINLPPLTPEDKQSPRVLGARGDMRAAAAAERGSTEKMHSYCPSPGNEKTTTIPLIHPPPSEDMAPPPGAYGPFGPFSTPGASAPYPPPGDYDGRPPALNPANAYPPSAPYMNTGSAASDPLLNDLSNPEVCNNRPNTMVSYQAFCPSDMQTIPVISGSEDGTHDPHEDEQGYPVNRLAPAKCELSILDHHPELHLAEGQREHIDQLQPGEDPAYCKWCMVFFFSIGSHIGFIICVFILIWQVPLKWHLDHMAPDEREDERVREQYNNNALITASVFIVFCWLVAIIESYVSDTRSYIENTMKLADFRKEHTGIRNYVPTIVWIGEAYHDDKERIIWKDGRIVGRRRSSDTHKCVTKYEQVAFEFTKCIDASGDLDTFEKGVINRFEFEKTFGFIDSASKEIYQARKQEFISRFEGKDEKFKFEETFALDAMKDKATVYMTEGCRTSLMSTSLYSCLTCFLLTWPYRIFFRCVTRKKKFTFVKLIGI